MAQATDYILADQSGAAFRAELNTILGAIATQNSGTSAPSTIYANMWWVDTTNSRLKKRNNGNTTWIDLGPMDSFLDDAMPVSSKSAGYTALAADRGKLIDFTAAATLGLTAAATLGDGWFCAVRNGHASATVTLDPNAAELIDGQATIALDHGEACLVVCDGSGFKTIGRPPTTPSIVSPRNVAADNGGLEVWQVGTSIAVAASTTAYTADRWALKTGANQASVVDQVAGIATGSRWAARIRRNSGQTGTGTMSFEYALDTDEVARLQGQVVTLSMTLKAGANWSPASGNLTVELRTGTGSAALRASGAYTGDAAPISTAQAITTTATRYAFTSSALGASITQASIYLTWTPAGTAGAADDFTIDDVQLEVASAATAFDRQDFDVELLRCQRFWEQSYNLGTAPGTSTTTGAVATNANSTTGADWWGYRFAVRKRAAPTVTLYSSTGASGKVRDITTPQDIAASAVSIGEAGFSVNLTPAIAFYKWHYTADARLA